MSIGRPAGARDSWCVKTFCTLLDDPVPNVARWAMASDLKTLDPAQALREVIRTIRDHETELRALGVAKLWLFGSLARGDVGRRSDVDVLISVPSAQKFSLLDLSGVRVELCELLGIDTDVVIREDVTPRFWQTIEDDLIEVF